MIWKGWKNEGKMGVTQCSKSEVDLALGLKGGADGEKKCLNNAKFYFPRFAIGDFTFLTRGFIFMKIEN